MVKTRHSMPAGRLAMLAGPPEAATGRLSTSAGKVTNGQNGTFNGRSTTGDVCRASDRVHRETAIAHFTSDDVRREEVSKRRATCHCHRWHEHSRLTRGARWYERVAVVFHRTHKER